MLRLLLPGVLTALLAWSAPPALADEAPGPLLSEALTLAKGEGDVREAASALWSKAIAEHGDLEPFAKVLEAHIDDETVDPAVRTNLRRLLARLYRHEGRPEDAKRCFDGLPIDGETVSDAIARGALLDAMGETEAAREAYGRAVARDAQARTLLRTRLALLAEKPGEALQALAGDAASEERNRLATLLALLGPSPEAIDLFVPATEGTARFRDEIRRAEWALEAKLHERAIALAEAARAAAKHPRDRRYALSVLVEAHRRADSLEKLAFALAREKDLSTEAREVRIDLLRESGQAEAALHAFRNAAAGETWTPQMQRQLLEICREAGRDEVLLEAYRRRIEAEPGSPAWRIGLSTYHLENGRRDAGVAVWDDVEDHVTDPTALLQAAVAAGEVGLTEVAVRLAESAAKDGTERTRVAIFLFEHHLEGGRLEAAEAVLDRLDRDARPDAAERAELALAFERLGRLDRAAAVLASLREAQGTHLGTDHEMHYALLLSKVGREEDALGVWRELWARLRASPRRRYIEDRMMNVASRLGTLGALAIELEDRLAAGSADDADVDLLVRLYSSISDSASATEVVEEYLAISEDESPDLLRKKANIYLECRDHAQYEETLHKLIEKSEEDDEKVELLRELVMSRLERGERKQALALLPRIRAVDSAVAEADEFEAGILRLAGMNDEALTALRRCLGRFPGRIDGHLLVGTQLLEQQKEGQAAGIYQQLAESADQDDLFAVAIDGILNLRAQDNTTTPDETVEWAMRLTLERLARSPNRFYLYRLLVDLATEAADVPMAVRTLRASVPIAGERRTTILREIMNECRAGLSRGPRRGFVSRNAPLPASGPDAEEYLLAGRRLLGQGEYVPPQVFMSLAEGFLAAGNVEDARRTFARAAELLGAAEVTGDAARLLDKARYFDAALSTYRRLLAVQPNDLSTALVTANLEEQTGAEVRAHDRYAQSLERILARKPLSVTGTKEQEKDDRRRWWGGNVAEEDQVQPEHMRGLVVTIDPAEADAILARWRRALDADLGAAGVAEDDIEERRLSHHPRAQARLGLLRQLAAAFGRWDAVEAADRHVQALFPKDKDLLQAQIDFRGRHGHRAAARALLAASAFEGDAHLASRVAGAASTRGSLTPSEAVPSIMGHLADPDAMAKILERVAFVDPSAADLEAVPVLLQLARVADAREAAERLATAAGRALLRQPRGATPGTRMPSITDLVRIADSIDPALGRAAAEAHLEAALEKDPRRLSSAVLMLGNLQYQGVDFQIDPKLARKIIQRIATTEGMYLGAWWTRFLRYLTPDTRWHTFQQVYDKVPPNQRAVALLNALSQLELPLEKEAQDWFIESFRTALAKADRVYANVGETPPELYPLLRRVLDVWYETKSDSTALAERAALRIRDGSFEDDPDGLLQDLVTLLGNKSQPYLVHRATQAIQTSAHGKRLFELLQTALEKDDAPEGLGRIVLDLLQRSDADAYRERLLRLHEKDPEDEDVRRRLAQVAYGRGRYRRALALVGPLTEKKGKDRQAENLRYRIHRSLDHPEAAEPFRFGRRAEPTAKPGDEAGPAPPANPVQMRDALKDGREEDARRILRRLWRGFDGRHQQYYWANPSQFRWPPEPPPEDPAEAETESRRLPGGLPDAYLDGEMAPLSRMYGRRPTGEEKSVFDVAAERTEFGLDEAQRARRAVAVDTTDRYGRRRAIDAWFRQTLLPILVRAEVKEKGAAATLERQVQAHEAGRAGDDEYRTILLLMEDGHVEPEQIAELLASLLVRADPRKSAWMRSLGRALARTRRVAAATASYRLACVASDDPQRRFSGAGSAELLEEAGRELGVEVRLALLEDLRASWDGRWPWWPELAVKVWADHLPPEERVARLEALRRDVAAPQALMVIDAHLVALHAAGGDLEQAKQRLGLVLEPEPLRPEIVRQFGTFRAFSPNLLPILFPKGSDVEWLRAGSAAAKAWSAKKKAAESSAFRIHAWIAIRLHEAGDAEGRDAATKEVARLAEDSPGGCLWVADLHRLAGRQAEAHAIERALLDEGLLHIGRVAPALERVAEFEDRETARRLGRQIAEVTTNEALLDLLLDLAEAEGDEAAAERWEKALEATRAWREEHR